MKNHILTYPLALAGLALAVTAGPLAAGDVTAPLVAERPTSQTEMWLQLQREGSASAEQRVQSATPAERELSMQRLLDSFTHPIPEYFAEDDGGSFER